ncbi:MAG: CBS domain-containing protein [Cyanobacteria bacterium J06621_11]
MFNEHLKNINEQLDKGVIPPKETVRNILGWFGVSRRGYNVVRCVLAEFEKYQLITVPNFEFAYIDEAIQFKRPGQHEDTSSHTADPIYRIGRLESANKVPISVKPDALLEKATTLMLTHDYSQLPVMTTERDVKGVISWRTIGSKLALGCSGSTVSDFMEKPNIQSVETSLFDAIRVVSESEYVLVQAIDRRICGIVTGTDLTLQFRNLAEPFLLIGETENHVRKLIHGKFSIAELQSIRNENDPDRMVESVVDLTFGEYVRLIENEDRWSKLNIQIDRIEFKNRLDRVRIIRNDVMHFDPDGLSEDDIAVLRDFAKFLSSLRTMGAF